MDNNIENQFRVMRDTPEGSRQVQPSFKTGADARAFVHRAAETLEPGAYTIIKVINEFDIKEQTFTKRVVELNA